jgi:hypothetical protein
MHGKIVRRSAGTLAGLSLAFLLGGCPFLSPPIEDMMTLSLSFSGLEPLGDEFVYEGWLLVAGAPVSAGRFSVDADGTPSPGSFEVAAATADAATLYILTIEPAMNDAPEPADTHVLAGAISNGVATLSIGHAAALGTDFAAAVGGFILETPSTSSIADDFAQGIWWLDPAGGPGASLVLPTLPDGWVYEGWVVGDDGPVSTGRFLAAAGADDDGVGPTAGMDAGPPFPGQDFIDPAVNLVGYAAVISVEPEPDNSAGPFTLKPLIDMNIENVGAGVLQAMANMAADTSPTGTVTIAE